MVLQLTGEDGQPLAVVPSEISGFERYQTTKTRIFLSGNASVVADITYTAFLVLYNNSVGVAVSIGAQFIPVPIVFTNDASPQETELSAIVDRQSPGAVEVVWEVQTDTIPTGVTVPATFTFTFPDFSLFERIEYAGAGSDPDDYQIVYDVKVGDEILYQITLDLTIEAA